MPDAIRAAILTISDRCASGAAEDTSGPAVAEIVRTELSGLVVATACVPDEPAAISSQLAGWAREEPRPDLILTTGGTGLGPRDVTPEATLAVLERRHPALLELARLRSFEANPRAFLSRGEAGTIGRSLVINLPGSRRGVIEVLRSLVDILPHAVEMLRGGSH